VRRQISIVLACASIHLVILNPNRLFAQLYTWEFPGGSGTVASNGSPPAGATITDFTRGTAQANGGITAGFGATNWVISQGVGAGGATVASLNELRLRHTIQANAGNLILLESYNFTDSRSATGPASVVLRMQTTAGRVIQDSQVFSVATTDTNRTFNFMDTLTADNIEFRWLGFNAMSAGGTYRLSNASGAVQTLSGSVAPITANYALTQNTRLFATDVNYTLSGVVSGSVGLSKEGTGTVTLTNANTYTGTTSIRAGKLVINNTSGSATGSGSVEVIAGGTLASGPSASIAGTLVVNEGSTLSIGDSGSIASLQVGGTIFAGATVSANWLIDLDLNNESSVDRLVSAGIINFENVTGRGNGKVELVLSSTGGEIEGTRSYTIATGTLNDFSPDKFVVRATNFFLFGYNFNLTSANELVLTLTPTPEPATVLLICAGAFGMVRAVRRRKNAEPEQVLAG
jgi:fibronectin-binding autotransporter adhesin